MSEKTVVVLGAGATKECGGPLTYEILPDAFSLRDESPLPKDAPLDLRELKSFLLENFGLRDRSKSKDDRDVYPGLPMLLSLLDTAIERNNDYGPGWSASKVREVRALIEYAVYQCVERKTENAHPYHHDLVKWLEQKGDPPTIISLNYDTLIDDALRVTDRLPDYGCDVAPYSEYESAEPFDRLFKIHGSLNWLYCPACNHLEVFAKETGAHQQAFSEPGYPCPAQWGDGSSCRARMRHIIVTPTHKKRYGNPHITSVWLGAERALREAERAILIGYSLPWDDVEVIYLLQRGLAHLEDLEDRKQITVVQHAGEGEPTQIDEHPAGKRYSTIFGSDNIDWRPVGFKKWLDSVRGNNE